MKKRIGYRILLLLVSAVNIFCANAQIDNPLIVKANDLKAVIQPTMWGVFFEDINMGADGGLYAEMVKNRSFEFSNPMMGWKEQKQTGSNTLIVNRNIENSPNPRFARVTINSQKPYGLTNEGFRGMGIKKGNGYDFSVWASIYNGQSVIIKAELISPKGEKLGSESVTISGKEWKKYKVSFTANATEPKAKLVISFEGKAVVDVDMVSLFPQDTWKKRPGGLRADLVQLLADMKPGFIRFPGGCIVEGRDLANRYQWKKTVGKIEDREVIVNRWNMEFAHKTTPDYFQSFGLGFFEYFQMAEDIGAEPLPILNCGMACQFNTAEVVATEQLDPYIQDALDLIEFANGSIDTKWGRLRKEMGHSNSFNLKFLGIGNENWGPQYIERVKIFTKALKKKYPNIQLVNSSGTDHSGERFDYLNGELRKMNADIIDEHYYRDPLWFRQNAKRYDSYDPQSSKVFAGEYAAQSKSIGSSENRNTWNCALSEAAFMTGLERNAGVVYMASYAPLFAHVDAWQWTPDLIWMDNLRSYGTPNYYVQKLFSLNKGTQVVPILLNNEVVAGQDSLFATASIDKKTNELLIKIVNTSDKEITKQLLFEGVKQLASKAMVSLLKSNDLSKLNSLDDPTALSPLDNEIVVTGKQINLVIPSYSLQVIKIKIME